MEPGEAVRKGYLFFAMTQMPAAARACGSKNELTRSFQAVRGHCITGVAVDTARFLPAEITGGTDGTTTEAATGEADTMEVVAMGVPEGTGEDAEVATEADLPADPAGDIIAQGAVRLITGGEAAEGAEAVLEALHAGTDHTTGICGATTTIAGGTTTTATVDDSCF